MAEWYYALGEQQKGPVPWETLQHLASTGKLAKNDMVWREGMAEWQKATQVEGLFPGSAALSPRRRVEAAPEVVDDGDDFDRDSDRDQDRGRPRRRKKRKKESSPGTMVAIIGGSVAGGLVILIIVIVLLVRSGRNNPQVNNGPAVNQGGGGGNAGGQVQTYTVTLNPFQENIRTFTFQQGQRVEITVTTNGRLLGNDPDVDLYVTRGGDPAFLVFDDDLSKDCFVQFVAPATDQYSLKLHNLGPGQSTSTVTIR